MSALEEMGDAGAELGATGIDTSGADVPGGAALNSGGTSPDATLTPGPKKRAWKRTKLRMLHARVHAGDAELEGSERDRLLKFHRLRLHLKAHQLEELVARRVVKLLDSDPGDGLVLSTISERPSIYPAWAVRLGVSSTIDDVLLARRVHAISKPPRDQRPPEDAIAAAERFMPDDPSVHDYTRFLCGGPMAQVLIIERKERLGGSHRYARAVADANAQSLLERAQPDLRAHLEDRGFGRIREVPRACAAQLLACKSEMLFGLGLLKLDLILRTALSRQSYHQMLLVKQIANCAGDEDLSTHDGLDRFARGYCIDRTLYPHDPETRRNSVGQFLLEAHIAIDREVRAAEPEVAAMLRRYLLPLPRMPLEFARTISKARSKQRADGEKVRKDRVEPLAESLPEARFLAGSRSAELQHDQRCCALAMAEVLKLDTSRPLEVTFSYRAPIYDEDGRRLPGVQRRHWTIRNTNRIHEMLAVRDDERMERALPRGDHHKPEYDTELWLFYDRSEGIDGSEPRDPWIKSTVDSLALYAGRGLPPELVKRQMAFCRSNGLPRNIANRLPAGFAWFAGKQASRAKRVVVDLNLRPWPITELCHGMLIAHAGTAVITTSGARTHEFFQIVMDQSRLFRLPLDGGEERFVFLAVPKGFDETVPFVITRDDVNAVWAAGAFACRRWHNGQPIPETGPCKDLAHKCGRGRYLANNDQIPLSPKVFTPLVQVLFVGRHELEGYDLRHGFASYAEGTGVPLEIIAAWLNQKALDITRYYAQAPKSAKDRWWLQFHSVVDLREFQGSAPLLQEAEKAAAVEQVGALTSVPGGTCVSLGECPVRFSCIGCRSNAADPDKRSEVEESMVAAQSLRDVWSRHGRVKAVDEQEAAIERHRRVLREMGLIEKYRAMREEVVEPELIFQQVTRPVADEDPA